MLESSLTKIAFDPQSIVYLKSLLLLVIINGRYTFVRWVPGAKGCAQSENYSLNKVNWTIPD